MRNNDLTRHMFNLRIANNITSKLSLDVKASYINEVVDNAPNDYAVTSIYRTPTSIPLDQMKTYEYTDINGDLRQSYWKPGSSIIGNPYYYMYRDLSYNQDNQLMGLMSLKYNFAKGIDLMVRGSVTKSFGRSENKIYNDAYFSLVGSDYALGTGNDLRSYADVLLTFNRKLNSNFTLSGNVGASVQGTKSDSSSTEANGLYKDNFFYMSNAKATLETNTNSKSPQVQAIYAEASLAFKEFLFLDVTGRNDWSSALPDGSYSIFYPSIGLTGVISDMVDLPSWINYGKVRISLANSGYGGNAYLGREYYSVAAGGLIVTPTVQSLGNYKPEMTSSLEAGLTWNFFNNRLGIDLTYYRTQTKNQLLLIGAPPASTYNNRYINAGLIQNSGIEAMINFTPIKTSQFAWDGYVNYAKNNNKVIRITDEMTSVIIQDDDIVTTKVETGKSFGTLYVKGWQRDEAGHKLVDDQGRPLLTQGKTVYAGNYNPDFTVGFSNNFSYKNFSLGFLINYVKGGTILGGTQALIDADGHSARSLEGRENGIVLDAYQIGGGKNETAITSQQYFSSIGDRKPAAEEYAYSATNVRLREVSLGYFLPKKVFKNISYIQNIRIALIGRNLGFFKRSTPFDPDIAQGRGGIEATALPFTRTMGINLKVAF
jgi:outer membrane receptor protein involved in Fe transport